MESVVHTRLKASPCLTLKGLRPVCVAKYVPRFFLSGQVVDEVTRTRHYVSLMNVARGVPLDKIINKDGTKRYIRLKQYLAVERAICALWLHGYVHADFHGGNIMLDPRSNGVTIIDFGFGTQLPPNMVNDVRTKVVEAIRAGVRSLGEVWQPSSKSRFGTDMQEYVNRVQYGRMGQPKPGKGWYNPDGHAMMMMYSRLSTQDREKLPEARRRLWGARK